MTSLTPRTFIFLAALSAAFGTSTAGAQESAGDSAVPSSRQRTGAERARRAEPAARVARSSRTRLEADVIGPRAVLYGDAYSLISALRPHWLSVRPPAPGVRVYRDGSSVGGADELRFVDLASVLRIEWLSGMDATARFGMNHGGGAILVFTRR
ncbi:MAG TPA: hypothetical protein VFR81_19760 [Longimicrobium sp.]|nr:hypothetical protein [Longimicrobium sp.]